MGWPRKKRDPISDRARDLNAEIASLEAQIKRLDARLGGGESTGAAREARDSIRATAAARFAPSRHEPVFEDVNPVALEERTLPGDTPEHYNEQGVRKFDLPAWWRRVKGNFHGPTTSNPKLVSYLAAGGIQGLSPLRREKRVARNRFFVLVTFLFLVLLGILIMHFRR
jgi:hypothetical protein